MARYKQECGEETLDALDTAIYNFEAYDTDKPFAIVPEIDIDGADVSEMQTSKTTDVDVTGGIFSDYQDFMEADGTYTYAFSRIKFPWMKTGTGRQWRSWEMEARVCPFIIKEVTTRIMPKV